MQNPQLRQIFNLVKNGGNPQVIYENLARQMGVVDPNYLLSKLMN